MAGPQIRMEPPHQSDAVIPPRSINQESSSARERMTTIVLDLSADRSAVKGWVEKNLPDESVQIISKSQLKWASRRDALRQVASLEPRQLVIFSSDIKVQSQIGPMILFGAFAGARRIIVADPDGGRIDRRRAGAFLIEGPRLLAEILFGYGFIIPATWALTLGIGALFGLRKIMRASLKRYERQSGTALYRALYLRATPVSSSAQVESGGMAAHTAGFTNGALELGHDLTVITSARAGFNDPRLDVTIMRPANSISATRALFELWNNLVFTGGAIKRVDASSKSFDFLYQRYSRFNWTGVVLSLMTGLPLLLEFNGSEVWVSRNWDPTGQLSLLGKMEALNLRAADVVFVVSEVERRNLIERGVPESKIRVNPNGVSIEEFRPHRGGAEIRRRLGIEDKIVIGFTGTFGPWHGAPVMARAAELAARGFNMHLIFVGDGDEREETEKIVREAGVSATFTGRVPREQVPDYLDACDILISPHKGGADGSDFFGSPTKLFEYMAMERPVIASRLGQPAEIIEDGESGILVESGSAEGLARAMKRLAGDGPLRARLGAAARATVAARYTWRHNAGRVFESIEEIT